MNWMAWIANKHILLVHLPAAAALLIPLPIIAAQRGGRGIRPWWTTCRFLGWAGFVTSLLAVVSGFFLGRVDGHVPPGAFWGSAEPGISYLFRVHELGGAACLVVGVGCLRSLYRKRLEHQGIGIPALLLGFLWCGVALATSYSGSLMTDRGAAPALFLGPTQAAAASAPAPAPQGSVTAQDPESILPLRALDFASLRPMHAAPVKSIVHGNRWIRVWLTPSAAQAYQAGQPLPPGTLAVLSTFEDHWGRPSFEPGPLYALEIAADGKPKLTFYWAQVPQARRGETQGAQRVYWRNDDLRLRACRACHEHGAAPMKDRSRLTLLKPLKTQADIPGQAPK
jgi:hypothetical protein